MKRTKCVELGKENIGEDILLKGWLESKRKLGKILFIVLRDGSGRVQLLVEENKDFFEEVSDLNKESVLKVRGKVSERPGKDKNPEMKTGKIEVKVENIETLSEAENLPIPIQEGENVLEDMRFKYRYLDLRKEKPKENLIKRHKIISTLRRYLDENGFIEVETPRLTKSTPEGARDFLVPSRLEKGKFYALPQSPQLFKQILMVSGIEKYYQLARCFRDEDLRADRQPEHTQLDIEMSFVKQRDILNLIEKLFIKIVEDLFPEKKITEVPFPRIPYKKAIKNHGTDRPDIRKNKEDKNELGFCFIVNFPLFEKTEEREIAPSHHPFTAPKDEDIPLLDKNPMKARSWQHDLVLNGHEIGGGSTRIHQKNLQEKIFEILGIGKKEAERKFGFFLEALKYGAPPHGGIAIGLDRVVAILCEEESIKEVIAFPKNKQGKCLLTGAPSKVDKKQLNELGIKLKK